MKEYSFFVDGSNELVTSIEPYWLFPIVTTLGEGAKARGALYTHSVALLSSHRRCGPWINRLLVPARGVECV